MNWHEIRSIDGSQKTGFEELCAQLARSECPDDAEFFRKGTPDAGVECYSVLKDGSEWGWQAKFLSDLDERRWPQIDESVKRALEKHPRLARYYVCTPKDRAEGRRDGQKSAMDRWAEHIAKWECWATQRDMQVAFVWWGSSELIERLSQDEHLGRRWFWFGQRFFDNDWFQQRLDEAIADAGPRYTPEVHIDLPIAQDLERFGRTTFVFDEVKSTAIAMRKAHRGLMASIKSLSRDALGIDLDDWIAETGAILESLSRIRHTPAGDLPFEDIETAADDAVGTGDRILSEMRDRQLQVESAKESTQGFSPDLDERFRSCLYYQRYLISEIERVSTTCTRANNLANTDVLLIKGDAGTGKTHLLCDLAQTRLATNSPTVLLLGQWFRGSDDPWSQLLQRLDLHSGGAERFVGALEAAAQASNCRALVVIDALNEGKGRDIWPDQLSSFLKRLEQSPWIAVILSVRSSYEGFLIPENVRSAAAQLTHDGFAGVEFNAIASYFAHYGIEVHSSPLLQPEFKNPLFLKTICTGLQERGETRIPVGFQGITAIFDLYLDTVNRRLAKELNYDPKNNLVRGALDDFARAVVHSQNGQLPRDQAIEVVNALLPGRSFDVSLYAGLISESVLSEDMGWATENAGDEVVTISYNRYADHIIADHLLQVNLDDRHDLDANSSTFEATLLWFKSTFDRVVPSGIRQMVKCERGSPSLRDWDGYMDPGMLEALCVQVPEKTGKELTRFEPKIVEQSGIGDAYLQSLIWRGLGAFSDDSLAVLNELVCERKLWNNPFHSLLTVSTVPGHFFNADYLNSRLRKDPMADRDSWWSVFLHEDWERQGAIFRLVNWASGVTPTISIDTEVVDLAVTTMVWSFTSSNRFLRDKATKATVALLTGRHRSTVRMLKRFADIDDPYVSERVYAVAYGVVMRSHDVTEVGELAELVYNQVFAKGTPPAHILLRDYARGVVERGIYLGADIPIEEKLIRPPYCSEFPEIPTVECIKALYPDRNGLSRNQRNPEWARDRIRGSVMDDDFYFYVIGKDSLSSWLALSLKDKPWSSPEERKQDLIRKLPESAKSSWVEYQDAERAEPVVFEFDAVGANRETLETITRFLDDVDQHDVEVARERVKEAYAQLSSRLTPEHRIELESILVDEQDWTKRHGPRFDKKLIQRYILGRVIDLGWTVDRFGDFDEFTIGHSGRDASKPERIGKKYQWIAYHEFLAYIADHLQYRHPYYDDHADEGYLGPWQEHLRDLDPSCTIASVPGGMDWGQHSPSWWAKESYEDWREGMSHLDWLSTYDDLPSIEQLMVAVDQHEDQTWLNVDGNFVWRQPHPADEDFFDDNRREIWIGITGYFVRKQDSDSFMAWAKTVNFWGRWMPEPATWDSVYFGEYGWSPAYRYFHDERFGGEEWQGTNAPNAESPVTFQLASSRCAAERGGFDCSIDEGFHLGVPHPRFINHFKLRWHGKHADYCDEDGKKAVFDPTAKEPGPNATLMREDLLRKYLDEHDLDLCWVVVGEKNITGGDAVDVYHGRSKISGAYRLTEDGPKGFTRAFPEIPESAG